MEMVVQAQEERRVLRRLLSSLSSATAEAAALDGGGWQRQGNGVTALTSAEYRLGLSSLLLGSVAVVAGLAGSAWGEVWGPGGLGMGACLLMVALEPRRHRPFLLPVLLMAASSAVVSVAQGWGWGWSLGWSALTLAMVVGGEGARHSVNGSWWQGGPPV